MRYCPVMTIPAKGNGMASRTYGEVAADPTSNLHRNLNSARETMRANREVIA